MRLLVTRPEPDATTLKAQLIARGHEVVIEPLLRIEFLPVDDVELDDVQAMIATSRNGVRALAASPVLAAAQALPIYTVGPGTAATATALGFQQVIEGPRDAVALVALIALQADVNAGPLLYLSGDTPAADVAGELRRVGFHVLEPVVYATGLADRLSPIAVERLTRGQIDGVLLLSAQTARTYARLILAHGLRNRLARVRHFCLSPAVARGLDALSPSGVETARAPSLKEVLALVDGSAPLSP